MLKDEIEKKLDFKKGPKKEQKQLVLTFETRDHGHKIITCHAEGNPKK